MAAPTARQVRDVICAELAAMLYAVARFEALLDDPAAVDVVSDGVALQDSALLHARKLVDFATAEPDADSVSEWALRDILGAQPRKVPGRLVGFLDEAVLGLDDLPAEAWKWPKDADGNRIDGADPRRLSKLADLTLKVLRPRHRTTTLETEAGAAYVEALDRAREYFEQRTSDALQRLTRSGGEPRRPTGV